MREHGGRRAGRPIGPRARHGEHHPPSIAGRSHGPRRRGRVAHERLRRRNTDSNEVIERRLKKAEDEYRERVKYDHVVTNDDVESTVAEIRRIVGLGEPSGRTS